MNLENLVNYSERRIERLSELLRSFSSIKFVLVGTTLGTNSVVVLHFYRKNDFLKNNFIVSDKPSGSKRIGNILRNEFPISIF